MTLVIRIQNSALTGTLREDVYSGTVAVSGAETSPSDGSFVVRFTDYATISGGQIALNCLYVATMAHGHMAGSWYYAGDTSPDGTLTLDKLPNAASDEIETPSEQAAVAWAKSLIGSPEGQQDGIYWYGCLAFVIDAYEKGANYTIRNGIGIHVGSTTLPADIWPANQASGDFLPGGTVGTSMTPPFGALVFWDSTHGSGDSHVALSIGGGQLVSTNVDQPSVSGHNGIHLETMAQFSQNSWNIYKGWWLPDQ